MLSLIPRFSALAVALAASTLSLAGLRFDRRVVDVAYVGNAQSEAIHGYDGHDVITGVANGKPFRQTRGWMHFAMTTFDDTDVSIVCTFVNSGANPDVPLSFDLVVEDSVIATRTDVRPSTAPAVVEIAVPFALTKGKTHITVIVRARGGLTPALRELRTVQDHYEVTSPHNLAPNPFGVAR